MRAILQLKEMLVIVMISAHGMAGYVWVVMFYFNSTDRPLYRMLLSKRLLV